MPPFLCLIVHKVIKTTLLTMAKLLKLLYKVIKTTLLTMAKLLKLLYKVIKTTLYNIIAYRYLIKYLYDKWRFCLWRQTAFLLLAKI